MDKASGCRARRDANLPAGQPENASHRAVGQSDKHTNLAIGSGFGRWRLGTHVGTGYRCPMRSRIAAIWAAALVGGVTVAALGLGVRALGTSDISIAAQTGDAPSPNVVTVAEGPGRAMDYDEKARLGCKAPGFPPPKTLVIDERPGAPVRHATMVELYYRLKSSYTPGGDVPELPTDFQAEGSQIFPLPGGDALVQFPQRLGGAYNWQYYFYLVPKGRTQDARLLEFESPEDGAMCMRSFVVNAEYDPKTRLVSGLSWANRPSSRGRSYHYVWTRSGFRLWKAARWLPDDSFGGDDRRIAKENWPIIFQRKLAHFPKTLR